MTVPAGTEVPLSASHDLLTFVNRRDRDRQRAGMVYNRRDL